MDKQDSFNMIEEIRCHRIIAILRHLPDDQVVPVFQTLADAGIRLVEVTMNTAGATSQIMQMLELHGGQMLIGAGTVSTVAQASQALAAGARFMVAPNFDSDVIAVARLAGCPILPGVLTPSEMMAAVKAGANLLKLFPASRMGTDYVRDVLAPLDDLNLVAVGGITPQNAPDWLAAGCIGVGLGSSLLDRQLLQEHRYAEIGRRVRQLVVNLTT
jgi:2-dehydro-3-deoxyphosphogluconate aldolase / (4S)-4-hydroxy-2-oxoglutarate aldolase